MNYILVYLTIVTTVLSIGITAPTFTQYITLHFNAPVGNKIFSREKKELELNAKNDTVIATAQMTEPIVAAAKVYER